MRNIAKHCKKAWLCEYVYRLFIFWKFRKFAKYCETMRKYQNITSCAH